MSGCKTLCTCSNDKYFLACLFGKNESEDIKITVYNDGLPQESTTNGGGFMKEGAEL